MISKNIFVVKFDFKAVKILKRLKTKVNVGAYIE